MRKFIRANPLTALIGLLCITGVTLQLVMGNLRGAVEVLSTGFFLCGVVFIIMENNE